MNKVFRLYRNSTYKSDTPMGEGSDLSPIPRPESGGYEGKGIGQKSEVTERVLVLDETIEVYKSEGFGICFRDTDSGMAYPASQWKGLKFNNKAQQREKKEGDEVVDLREQFREENT